MINKKNQILHIATKTTLIMTNNNNKKVITTTSTKGFVSIYNTDNNKSFHLKAFQRY